MDQDEDENKLEWWIANHCWVKHVVDEMIKQEKKSNLSLYRKMTKKTFRRERNWGIKAFLEQKQPFFCFKISLNELTFQ